MNESGKARVGILGVGLAAYWPQFAGMRERLLGHYAALTAKLDGACEIVDCGLVDTIEAARAAGQTLLSRDVDVLFCHLTTYATSEPLMVAVSQVDVPIVLLNVQSVEALDVSQVVGIADWLGVAISCAALPEMTNALMRTGKRFDILTGYLDGDALLDEAVGEWCRVAAVRRTLRDKSLGLLGRPYPGMTDLAIDETALLGQLGAHVAHLNWDDVADRLAGASSDAIERRTKSIRDTFDVPPEVDAVALRTAATVLCAFDRLIADRNLCALPNHYEGAVAKGHEQILAASNVAFSVLASEGIACAVEGDIKAAIALVALKCVAGPATLAELYSMNFREDLVIIGHSGACDPSLSERRPVLKSSAVFHGKSGAGFLTQAYPKPGPMTLMSLTQSADGAFRLVAAEGEIVAGPAMELGDMNCRVRFNGGLRKFVKAWAESGPTHHGAMALGHHLSGVERLARLLGIELTVVCRN